MTPRVFLGKIDAHIRSVEAKVRAVHRESTKRVIQLAQTPIDQLGGGGLGRMPVRTGFLRNTGRLSFDGLPTGPASEREDPSLVTNEWQGEAEVILALAQVEPGQKVWFGWTANYARYQEYDKAFLRGAAEQWPQIVDQVVREVRAKLG